MALVVVGAAFTGVAVFAGATRGSRPWLEWLRRALTLLMLVEVLAGAVLYGAGHRPEESLHLLYGIAGLVALPFGSYFAAEAPPRPRAIVLAVGGILTMGIFFRSFATG